MADNILLGALRRYEFYSNISNFLQELYKTVTQELYGDIHWEWGFSTNNAYALPRAWNYQSQTGSYQGTITAKNKKDPSMFFTLCTNLSRWAWNNTNDHAYYQSYLLRTGFRNNGTSVIPDLYTNVGAVTEIPFHTGQSGVEYGSGNKHVNVYYKWNLFITDQYIFIYGEPQGNLDVAYPFRLYMGRLKPFEAEDPQVANDFVGIFGHYPQGMNDSNDNLKYSAGRGYVRTSRNGTPNTLYHFATSSQIPSPGVGGRFFISPFYVWHGKEGVRGEFYGIRTAVLKDASKYPSGSLLDLGDERYYIFHALTQANPATHQAWYATNGAYYKGQPYFLDSSLLLGGGQRVLLFEIEKEA